MCHSVCLSVCLSASLGCCPGQAATSAPGALWRCERDWFELGTCCGGSYQSDAAKHSPLASTGTVIVPNAVLWAPMKMEWPLHCSLGPWWKADAYCHLHRFSHVSFTLRMTQTLHWTCGKRIQIRKVASCSKSMLPRSTKSSLTWIEPCRLQICLGSSTLL